MSSSSSSSDAAPLSNYDAIMPMDVARRRDFTTNRCDDDTNSQVVVQFGGFIVSVRGIGGRYRLDPANASKATDTGVGIFVLPTQVNYSVNITRDLDVLPGLTCAGFSIKSMHVGGTRVIINNIDSDITYHGSANVSAFITNVAEQQFRFVSPSSYEKENNMVPGDVMETLKTSNIITMELQARKAKPVRPYNIYDELGLFCNVNDPAFRPHSATTNHGPIQQQQYGREQPRQPDDYSCVRVFEPRPPTYGAPAQPASSIVDTFGGQPSVASTFGTFGTRSAGSTVAGRGMTPNVATVKNDGYDTLGPSVSITLQLICTQSDDEKRADNLRYTLLQESGFDYWQHRANTYTENVRQIQAVLDQFKSKMKVAESVLSSARARVIEIVNSEEMRTHIPKAFVECDKSQVELFDADVNPLIELEQLSALLELD